MPGMNCEPNLSINTNMSKMPENQNQKPTHEITLTDKLNKKLLQSFLKNINETNGPFNNLTRVQSNGTNNEEEINEFI